MEEWVAKINKWFFVLFHHRVIIDRLNKDLCDPMSFWIREFKIVDGKIQADLKGAFSAFLAAWVVGMFEDAKGKAPNYITMDIVSSITCRKYEITLRREEGKSPGEIISELKEKIKELESK